MVPWAAPSLAQSPMESKPANTVPQPASGCENDPLAVVARFLSLNGEQIQATAQLLREREEALSPVLQEIARREQRIRELVASGGDPAEIGRLFVEADHLRQLAAAIQAQILTRFESLLSDEQRGRWQQVRAAAALQPVLPAFAALQIL